MSARFALAESPSGVGIVAPVDYILVSNGDGTWNVAPAPSGGGVTSWNGRSGAVVPVANDYSADQVASAVDGPHVSDSLAANKTLATNAFNNAAAAQTSANTAITNAAAAQTSANTAITNAATADAKAVAAQQPLKGTYYVNPTFAGTQLGSESSPFTSITAAMAAAVTAGFINYTVFLCPGCNTTENVTFPNTGEVNIVGLTRLGNSTSCIITGNVNIPATASARRWISDLQINGNITGLTSAGVHRITFERVTVTGTTTLTQSGAGTVRIGCIAGAISTGFETSSNMGYCFFTGAVSVQGTIWAASTTFLAAVTCSGRCTFNNVNFLGTLNGVSIASLADNTELIFTQCSVSGQTVNISQSLGGALALVSGVDSNFDNCTFNFTGIGINVFGVDKTTAQTFYAHGGTVTGVTPTSLQSVRLTGQVNNKAVTLLGAKSPIPQQRANATLTLVTPGTAGNAVLNIIYTDSLGVSRTKAVTPVLNIAGAAGDEVQGSFLFTQDGSTNFQYSVTGIATPGALSYNLCVSIEPAS